MNTEARNRITGLEPEAAKISFAEEKKSSIWRWYILLPLALLLIGVIGTGVWYVIEKKKSVNEKGRLAEDELPTRHLFPDNLPQDEKLAKAVDMFNRGFDRAARALFTDIVESSSPAEVKAAALIYLGIMSDKEGKFSLAVDYFKRAARFDPQNFHAHYGMAVSLRHQGLFKEAMAELEAAQKLRPDISSPSILKGQIQMQNNDLTGAENTLKGAAEGSDPYALYNLGMVYKSQGKMAEAKASFIAAMGHENSGEIGWKAAAQLGMIHATQGDYANAKFYFEKAATMNPTDPKYRYNVALIEYRMGNREAALANLEQAVKNSAAHPKAYVYIARLYQELGQKEKARQALEYALEIAPADYEVMTQLADVYVKSGNWNQAISLLTRVIDHATTTADKAMGYLALGNVYREMKDWQRAKEALEKAQGLDPLNEDALVSLGMAYQAAGEPHLAISKFRSAMKLNPDNHKISSALLSVYLDTGVFTEAESIARGILDSPTARPGDKFLAYRALGTVFKKRQAYDTAIRYLEKAVEDPDEKNRYQALVEIADCIIASDRPSAEAFPYLEKAIALHADSTLARLFLARALLKNGSIASQERAEEELTAVIEKRDGDNDLTSKAHTLRGIIFYKQGFYAKSLDDFNRALEIDPSNRQAFENKRAAAARLEESP